MPIRLFSLALVVIALSACTRHEKVEIPKEESPKSTTQPASTVASGGSDKNQSLLKIGTDQNNGVNIPDTFITVQPSIDALFIHAFNREAKEKEWEAIITGVVLTSPDWEEVNDKNTQEILGRTRTATILAKGEEGRCIVFEQYTIFQAYKNGSFIGKPRGYSFSPSKDIDCKKYEHLMFKSVKQNEFDERNE
ncbi:MAG: hypothetical protein MUF71_08775 [Candidatus Kapabacteria bacterium]|jgi:hypothetical protein|nr:hypothetical protein [Candidatus Kapabacteria bacterium]